ncbi:dihydropteroate synthase [Desulfuribacillus stibiiarsenatis]|uniref:Dihydropteroate synthase n=1 Tax=Desulfuribacillus stibiiarsenatis TaxID=1390249 RepID=A0A1E5L2K4_9FIRM|nr:dihydropteroate synthase [Desulfuribacillus stibiiarsenatis]OEH84392.1 dihydropteroate synthase [Desulfuribacillus stibiiarsenatis]
MNRHNVYFRSIYNQKELQLAMSNIGADSPGIHVMKQKGEFFHIVIHDVNLRAANLIKQELLSKGGDACVHKQVSQLTADHSDIMLLCTRRELERVISNFQSQPFGLKQLAIELKKALTCFDMKNKPTLPAWAQSLKLPLKERTLIMGILNVTPDSFSDGGRFIAEEKAVVRALEMIDQGADILDIGGESTRPGAVPVDIETELQRVIPIIHAIKKVTEIPISVDTYKAEVAKAAVEAGADMINDIWGLKKDSCMAKVAADTQVPVIIMHNRANTLYADLISDMISDLRESVQIAEDAGVLSENIILDPGIGFAKDYPQNLEVMYRLRDITNLGYPTLLGTSRKSLIAKTLNLPVEERIEGTAATVALGIERGVDIVRVHDVREMKRVCVMMDAMVRRGDA